VRANRHKPSGIAATESIVKWHLRPTLGAKCLDAITNEQVQKLKLSMAQRAPKTVNNVLTEHAVEEDRGVGELDKLPCTIKLLANPKKTMGFHDFEEYERLLVVAQRRSHDAYVMVLLGGDAGLRLGEIVALQWGDVDLHARRLNVQRSLVRSCDAAERRPSSTPADDAATDECAEGVATPAIGASVVSARWHGEHAR
jgi:integrase